MRWISLILLIALGLDIWSHHPVDEVAFLKVGQGDATLISKGDTRLLVDSGPRSLGFDGGQRFVWPELHRRGVYRLDAVVITHFDRDHYGGLGALLKRVAVDRVIVVSPDGVTAEERQSLIDFGMRSNQLVILDSAQRLVLGEVEVDVVPGFYGAGVDDNLRSPYLGVDFGIDRVVLTGDAPTEVEDYWRSVGVRGGQIVKAGHHGSNLSLSFSWLKAMNPRYVVFSSGRNNPWGHPDRAAVERAVEFGAEPLRTDTLGTVVFRPDSQGELQLVTGEDGPSLLKFFQR